MKTIVLPNNQNSNETVNIEVTQRLVLIGANGSGKSRMGAWLENKYTDKGWRITAQKSLEIPDSFQLSSKESAFSELAVGRKDLSAIQLKDHYPYRSANKYKNKPTGANIDDFQGLLKLLSIKNAEHAIKHRDGLGSDLDNPKSELQILKKLWEKVLPHRELDIGSMGTIKTKVSSGKPEQNSYFAGEMSDGERVMFYLIGKSLVAPPDAFLVIDEPELHLHPTIRDALWEAIESERKDCTFIYITHDITFAISRMEEDAIWLKDFDGTNWQWEIIKRDETFPTDLQLTLLGSRRPVLFVEADKNKTDHRLYTALYPDFVVIPCGSCAQVSQYVRTATQLANFNHIKPAGILDADNRSEDQIGELKRERIFTLNASEIENLFWSPEVLALMATFEMKASAATEAQDLILKLITDNLDCEILPAIIKKQVQRKLVLDKRKNIDDIKDQLINLSIINVDDEVNNLKSEIETAIAEKKWEVLIQRVEKKSLSRDIAELFGFKADAYMDKVLRYLSSNEADKKEKMRAAFAKYIPEVPQ